MKVMRDYRKGHENSTLISEEALRHEQLIRALAFLFERALNV